MIRFISICFLFCILPFFDNMYSNDEMHYDNMYKIETVIQRPVLNSYFVPPKVAVIVPVKPKVVKYKSAKVIPKWIMSGILMTESSSFYKNNGINYVNKTNCGGAIGPFQMEYKAWLDIRKRGEHYGDLKKNPLYAEECTARYLLYIKKNFADSWKESIMMYHTGPNSSDIMDGIQYYNKVKKHGL